VGEGFDVEKDDTRFYSAGRLNRWFAASSLLLLVTVLWMVWDDYARPWKDTQREFFGLDAEAGQAALVAEEERLAQEGTLEELEAELARAEEALSSRAEELEDGQDALSVLEVSLYRTDQDHTFAKAVLDARRYDFEAARARRGAQHPETERARKTFTEAQTLEEQRREDQETTLREHELAAERVNQLLGRGSELEKQRDRLLTQANLLRRRIRSALPGVVATVRNLPIVDFANPSVKVRQVVLRHFQRDYHFANVFRVDRCVTCHMGIDRVGFEDTPQPFTTHPRLDLYLTSRSPHPVEGFGCTVCHGGKDRATDFVDAVHTPVDEEQRSSWVEQYGWHELEHWEDPMLPGRLVESSCRKCHLEEDTLPDAALYTEGKLLYERLGCFNCHKTEGFTEELRKVGPSLAHVADKVTPEWAFRWIMDPASQRPTTRMPSFFGLSNNSDPESLARSQVEVRALVAYLFGQSTASEPGEPPEPTSAEAGERLYRTVGCTACHVMDDPNDPGSHGRDVGPNLSSVGSKTSFAWLYGWLLDPQKHFPGARMPSLRLTSQEAGDIAAFLTTRKAPDPAEGDWTLPEPDPALLESMTAEKLMEKAPAAEARARSASMSRSERLIFLGERLMAHYGCFGCHDVPGQEAGVRVGRDFTGQEAVGDKPLETVVFGFVDIRHSWPDWMETKLESPRIFDRGFERRAADKLRMPKFGLTPRQRQALVCYLLSLTNEEVPPGFSRRSEGKQLALQRGDALLREFNCLACHRSSTDRLVFAGPRDAAGRFQEVTVRGEVTAATEDEVFFRALEDREVADLEFFAGEFAEVDPGSWQRWERPVGGYSQDELLWTYAMEEGFDYEREEVDEGDEDALAAWAEFRQAHSHLLPPLLEGEGARAQPDWLFHFLKQPFDMRLQLDVRMPDFSLSDVKARALVEYFAARDGADFPFLSLPERDREYRQDRRQEILRARAMFDSQEVQCISCHIRGGILPEGDKANWGPDLALAPRRLRPQWILRWLEDPQLLQPGTAMPTFRSFTDADKEAMKDFLMNFDHFYPTAVRAAQAPDPGAARAKLARHEPSPGTEP